MNTFPSLFLNTFQIADYDCSVIRLHHRFEPEAHDVGVLTCDSVIAMYLHVHLCNVNMQSPPYRTFCPSRLRPALTTAWGHAERSPLDLNAVHPPNNWTRPPHPMAPPSLVADAIDFTNRRQTALSDSWSLAQSSGESGLCEVWKRDGGWFFPQSLQLVDL